MSCPPPGSLTEREAEIMSVLWAEGPSTAAEICAAIPHHLHNATVRTMLRLLEEKGHVRRSSDGVRGKAYVYRAVTRQASAEGNALRAVLQRFFGGSASALVARLVDDEYITPEELAELKKPAPKKPTKKNPKKKKTSKASGHKEAQG